MRNKLLTFVCILSFAPFVGAQVQTPQASPHVKTTQTVGLTEITLEYSRPGVKERDIFGELIPFGEIWRTGANENTTITFSDDVQIDGKELSAGTYAIYTKPNEGSWEVYFYEDTKNWGMPKEWDDSKIALRTEAEVNELPFTMETFSIVFDEITNNSATVNFVWENTVASWDFQVPTEEKTMKSIKTTMAGTPTVNDYFAAASYYLSEEKDLDKALEWMNSAIDKNGGKAPYYMLYQKAQVEAKLGMKKEASKTAKRSLEAAEKAGNDHYIKQNEALLEKLG